MLPASCGKGYRGEGKYPEGQANPVFCPEINLVPVLPDPAAGYGKAFDLRRPGILRLFQEIHLHPRRSQKLPAKTGLLLLILRRCRILPQKHGSLCRLPGRCLNGHLDPPLGIQHVYGDRDENHRKDKEAQGKRGLQGKRGCKVPFRMTGQGGSSCFSAGAKNRLYLESPPGFFYICSFRE